MKSIWDCYHKNPEFYKSRRIMFVKKLVKNLGFPDKGYICNFQSKAFMLCTKFLIYNLKDLNILDKICWLIPFGINFERIASKPDTQAHRNHLLRHETKSKCSYWLEGIACLFFLFNFTGYSMSLWLCVCVYFRMVVSSIYHDPIK